jgi:hypothetical protein
MAHDPRLKFFDEIEITNTAYPKNPQFDFNFRATLMIIAVNGRGSIEWLEDTVEKIDPSKPDGKILESDGPIVFDDIDVRKLWFKTEAKRSPKVRVWAKKRQA